MKRQLTNRLKQFSPKNHMVYWQALSLVLSTNWSVCSTRTHTHTHTQNNESVKIALKQRLKSVLKHWMDVLRHMVESYFWCLKYSRRFLPSTACQCLGWAKLLSTKVDIVTVRVEKSCAWDAILIFDIPTAVFHVFLFSWNNFLWNRFGQNVAEKVDKVFTRIFKNQCMDWWLLNW